MWESSVWTAALQSVQNHTIERMLCEVSVSGGALPVLPESSQTDAVDLSNVTVFALCYYKSWMNTGRMLPYVCLTLAKTCIETKTW